MSGSGGTGTYVYGVARAAPFQKGEPIAAPGIGGPGDRVRTIAHDDVVAVVSDAPGARIEISRDTIMGHQRVLAEVLRRSDVLPASFGTVGGSDEEVRERLLARELDELHGALAHITGRVEIDLKVFWERERLFAEIAAENDELRALRDRIAAQPPDATYYDRITLGQMTEAAVNAKSDEEANAILDALEPLAAEMRLNENLVDMMALNAAFLVDSARVRTFDARLVGLRDGRAGRLIFRATDPLPPYSFVNLRIAWEG